VIAECSRKDWLRCMGREPTIADAKAPRYALSMQVYRFAMMPWPNSVCVGGIRLRALIDRNFRAVETRGTAGGTSTKSLRIIIDTAGDSAGHSNPTPSANSFPPRYCLPKAGNRHRQ
jgi:hypothetical protein